MRKYLATLHKRSDEHKRRFAFLASGGFTLMIFAIWTLVTLGPNGTLAENSKKRPSQEVTPFESITANTISGFEMLGDLLVDFKKSVQEKMRGNDFGSDYQDMRNDAIKVYGQ